MDRNWVKKTSLCANQSQVRPLVAVSLSLSILSSLFALCHFFFSPFALDISLSSESFTYFYFVHWPLHPHICYVLLYFHSFLLHLSHSSRLVCYSSGGENLERRRGEEEARRPVSWLPVALFDLAPVIPQLLLWVVYALHLPFRAPLSGYFLCAFLCKYFTLNSTQSNSMTGIKGHSRAAYCTLRPSWFCDSFFRLNPSPLPR